MIKTPSPSIVSATPPSPVVRGIVKGNMMNIIVNKKSEMVTSIVANLKIKDEVVDSY